MKYARKTNIVEVKVLRVIEYQIQQEYQFIGLDMIDETELMLPVLKSDIMQKITWTIV